MHLKWPAVIAMVTGLQIAVLIFRFSGLPKAPRWVVSILAFLGIGGVSFVWHGLEGNPIQVISGLAQVVVYMWVIRKEEKGGKKRE